MPCRNKIMKGKANLNKEKDEKTPEKNAPAGGRRHSQYVNKKLP